METTTIIGFTLLLLGAACGGSFGLPSKFVKEDTPWETLWGPFFLFVTILVPCTVFPLVAKGMYGVVAEAGVAVVIMPVIFGFLWGLGSMTLGMSFAFVGLSLAYALNYGAQIVVGSMGPFLLRSPEQLSTSHGLAVIAGVVVCIIGVVICGRAGVLKTKSQEGDKSESDGKTADSSTIVKGMVIALLSGVLCACYGIAFSYGDGVMKLATGSTYGIEGWRAAFVVSALILWGGSLSATGYCVVKLFKNKTWNSLSQPGIGKVLFIALIMALLHDGAILFFGIGASKLGGNLGIGIGYAVFMSFAIIVGNVNGFLTKEWKGASRQSVAWIAAGIMVLVVGVCVLGKANVMKAEYAKKAAEAAEAAKAVEPAANEGTVR